MIECSSGQDVPPSLCASHQQKGQDPTWASLIRNHFYCGFNPNRVGASAKVFVVVAEGAGVSGSTGETRSRWRSVELLHLTSLWTVASYDLTPGWCNVDTIWEFFARMSKPHLTCVYSMPEESAAVQRQWLFCHPASGRGYCSRPSVYWCFLHVCLGEIFFFSRIRAQWHWNYVFDEVIAGCKMTLQTYLFIDTSTISGLFFVIFSRRSYLLLLFLHLDETVSMK